MAKPYPPELLALLDVLQARGYKIEIIGPEHDGAGDPTIRRTFAEQFADPPPAQPAPEPPGKTIEDLERDLATIDERSLTRDSELRNALKGVLAPLDSIALGQSNLDHDIGSLVIRLDDLRKATADNIAELHSRLDGEVDRLLKRIEALEKAKPAKKRARKARK